MATWKTKLVQAVDIETGWWTYRVSLNGAVSGKCPDEPQWLPCLEEDFGDDDEVQYADLIAAAGKVFAQAGILK